MKILIADSRKLPLEKDFNKLLRLISEEDRLRAGRFIREEDRVRCAAGAFLIRRGAKNILAEKGITSEFTISRTVYGKPFVKEYPDIMFSLSHSGDMTVYACSDSEIGADVEKIRDIDISGFGNFFDKEEMRRISEADEPLTEFYRIWTVKEAFSKKEGIGLSLFENDPVYTDYDRGQIIFHGEISSVKTFTLDGHIISVCVKGSMPVCEPHFITPEEWEKELNKR